MVDFGPGGPDVPHLANKMFEVFHPLQRSLSQVKNIVMRNIYWDGLSFSSEEDISVSGIESYFELWKIGTTEVIYRSVPERNTLNPSWTLSLDSKGQLGAESMFGTCQRFHFVLYAKTDDQSERALIFREDIDLKVLAPLHLKELLSLYRLPLNTAVFQLGQCGFFVTPRFVEVLKVSTGMILQSPKTTDIKEFSKNYIDTFLERLAVTEDTITQTRVEREKLEGQVYALMKGCAGTAKSLLERAQLTNRVQNLQRMCNYEEEVYLAEKLDYESRCQIVKNRAEKLRAAATAATNDAETDLLVGHGDTSVEDLQKELGTIRERCRICEVTVVIELKRMYPIFSLSRQNDSGETAFSIRGLQLPQRNLTSYDEDQISTALGCVCHLVSLLGDFFDIPFRYTLIHRGSRSCIGDDFFKSQPNTSNEFPLYWTGNGATATRFDLAKRYLEHCIDRVLAVRKVVVPSNMLSKQHMLAKLMCLFEQELAGEN